jgi:hypothetical protein
MGIDVSEAREVMRNIAPTGTGISQLFAITRSTQKPRKNGSNRTKRALGGEFSGIEHVT